MRSILFLLLGLAISSALFADENVISRAKESAKAWLAFVDSGRYGESWDEASQAFRDRITKKQWEESVQAVRHPLGKVVTREMKNAQYSTSLPGAPDGEYVVAQFSTSFEKKKSAVETVVVMLEKDGQWRITGYFIK